MTNRTDAVRTGNEHDTPAVPKAVIAPARRFSFAWLVPIAALVIVAFLVYDTVATRGPAVTIRFDHGHDLKPNDPLVFRGVEVGAVETVKLTENLAGVDVIVRLKHESAGLAVDGSRFWIVRPELSLTRIAGVETLLGPRYIQVAPGSGVEQHVFEGLPQPPMTSVQAENDLQLILEASAAGSVQEGSPITYRDIPVGEVIEVGLTTSGQRVEVHVRIQADFAHLVRENSRFWNAGGIGMNLGFSGFSVQAESLQAILTGGVGFATPKNPGAIVEAGHRFELAGEVDESWLKWRPDLTPSE